MKHNIFGHYLMMNKIYNLKKHNMMIIYNKELKDV